MFSLLSFLNARANAAATATCAKPLAATVSLKDISEGHRTVQCLSP